jgi:hypothetical protein
MFPSSTIEKIEEVTPKINPILGEGIAVEHMKTVEEYVDSIWTLNAPSFPEGMKYHGCRKCTPVEEYLENTKKKGSKCVFDVARSDVYLMEYKFSYNGLPLRSKYLFLPFVSKAGAIHISGSRFVISPILADRVISVGIASVFVRLLKARITVNRIPHHYVVNGQRESIQVAWSDIYNKRPMPNAAKPTVRANCVLVHYLFCKFGFSETFKKFGVCTPVVGTEEITKEVYPEEDWVICHSTQMKPKGFGKSFYEASNLKLAIPRKEYTAMVKSLVAGFFYIVDHFPTRLRPADLEYKSRWMVLLGHLIWSGMTGEGKLQNDVEDHIASLDEYLDLLTARKLEKLGFYCDTIYSLFALIIDKFNEWLLSSDDRVSTMYGKELSVLPFICYEITSSINNLCFKLKSAQKKELTERKITSIMNKYIKSGAIYKITKNPENVTTTTTSGDNMALKITHLLVPQSAATRNKGSKNRKVISDPSNQLHASIAEVGQYAALPKSEPTGRSRLALTLNVDADGLVLRDPKFVELIDSVQRKIRR